MTLLNLLGGVCFVTPVVAAFQNAKHARAGFIGWAAAITIGAVLGFGCTWLMWRGAGRTAEVVRRSRDSRREKYLSTLFLTAAVLWLLFVAFLADSITSAILRVT